MAALLLASCGPAEEEEVVTPTPLPLGNLVTEAVIHATIMLSQGSHPKVVIDRLGHSSLAITLDTYSNVLPGIQAAAALRFDEGLQKTAEKASSYKVGQQLVSNFHCLSILPNQIRI